MECNHAADTRGRHDKPGVFGQGHAAPMNAAHGHTRRMTSLSRWLPFLNWPRPDAALLRNEFSAGLTVALVMVPQCVAYAGLTGMPLITGLYAALLPLLV